MRASLFISDSSAGMCVITACRYIAFSGQTNIIQRESKKEKVENAFFCSHQSAIYFQLMLHNAAPFECGTFYVRSLYGFRFACIIFPQNINSSILHNSLCAYAGVLSLCIFFSLHFILSVRDSPKWLFLCNSLTFFCSHFFPSFTFIFCHLPNYVFLMFMIY